jgi:Tfp pilus assembly protein PilE
MKLSKLSKINIILGIIFVLLAFLYPVYKQKVVFASKQNEVLSISQKVQKVQDEYYLKNKSYLSLAKGDMKTLINDFDIKPSNIEFYDYYIITTVTSYTLFAQPKIQYIKDRSISAKIYSLHKKLNTQPKQQWK